MHPSGHSAGPAGSSRIREAPSRMPRSGAWQPDTRKDVLVLGYDPTVMVVDSSAGRFSFEIVTGVEGT